MELNKDALMGKWEDLKVRLKSRWGKLTDEDLATIEGNLDQIRDRLQKLYGYSKKRLESELSDFLGNIRVHKTTKTVATPTPKRHKRAASAGPNKIKQ